MKRLNFYISILVLFSLCSCSSDEQLIEGNIAGNDEITEIKAIIAELETDEVQSRTSFTTGTYPTQPSPVWMVGDSIGIYPDEGDQLSFRIETSGKTCPFNGGGWAMKASSSYTAYSPFQRSYYYKEKSALPINMLGQVQTGNDNADHLGAYDIQIAKGDKPETGSLVFQFERKVALVRMELKAPCAATWKTVTLESNAAFTTKATMNLSLEVPTLTPTTQTNSISFALENVKTTSDNLNIIAYMMLLPVDLTGKTLSVKLTDVDDNVYTANATVTNNKTNISAGAARWITAEFEANATPTIPYVTFSAEKLQTLSMSKAVETLEYSVNGGEWKTLGTSVVVFGGDNGDLRLRGKSLIGTKVGDSSYHFDYNSSTIVFGNAGLVSCVGDIRTLLDYEDYINVSTQYATFSYLFNNCYQLISAPLLPATLLADGCYFKMFAGCHNLASAPSLAATTLNESCYEYMFSGCKSLISAPELPATTLASRCYYGMFSGCEGLVSTPSLPATTLEDWCYFSMFYNCSNLVSAPSLPATTLADYCYYYMFSGCSKLSTVPSLPALVLKDGCYKYMFSGCTILTSAPVLSVSTLAKECYAGMFSECVNLKTAPSLPALILAKGCYQFMFSGCTNLESAPVLSATVLAESCYAGMFSSCNGLTVAPSLSATTLAPNCYAGMFSNCINLSEAPALPATQLANGCYGSQSYGGGMFEGCKKLTEAPMLPAATLVDNCYYNMFTDCTNLNIVTMLATDVTATGCLKNWLSGVSSTGTFTKAKEMTSLPTGSNGIPIGWTVKNYGEVEDTTPYLTFIAASTQTLTMSKSVNKLQYSVGGSEWTTLGTTTVTFGGVNGDLRLRGKNSYGTATDDTNYSQISFGNDVPVACGGDIRTLIDYENYSTVNTGNARFCCLFYECSNLIKAPALPSEALADKCYYFMFRGCESLTEAPSLPATALAESCYGYMFRDCKKLTKAPVLPATILADRCYEDMFDGCKSLIEAPLLPAETLAAYCYSYMFYGCESLTGAPTLPAKVLKDYCYNHMFNGCKTLDAVTMLATDISASNSLINWVGNVSSMGTFTKAKEMTSLPSGASGIPTGWTVVDYEE